MVRGNLASKVMGMVDYLSERYLIQRLRRWLATRTLTWRTVYHPMAKQLLANWQGAEIALVMAW